MTDTKPVPLWKKGDVVNIFQLSGHKGLELEGRATVVKALGGWNEHYMVRFRRKDGTIEREAYERFIDREGGRLMPLRISPSSINALASKHPDKVTTPAILAGVFCPNPWNLQGNTELTILLPDRRYGEVAKPGRRSALSRHGEESRGGSNPLFPTTPLPII